VPRQLVVAKASADQLERSQALPADQSRVTAAIQAAESSHMNRVHSQSQGSWNVVGKERCHCEEYSRLNRLRALTEILNDLHLIFTNWVRKKPYAAAPRTARTLVHAALVKLRSVSEDARSSLKRLAVVPRRKVLPLGSRCNE